MFFCVHKMFQYTIFVVSGFVFFWGGAFLEVFRDYFWFCPQESLLVGLDDHSEYWKENPSGQYTRQTPYTVL